MNLAHPLTNTCKNAQLVQSAVFMKHAGEVGTDLKSGNATLKARLHVEGTVSENTVLLKARALSKKARPERRVFLFRWIEQALVTPPFMKGAYLARPMR